MPLAIQRLLESDFSALASAAEWRAGVTLWMRSWQEVPAGSLPADDVLLAKKAGVTPREWEKLKPMALRGWVLCTDGRLYHRVVAELVLEAWLDKLGARSRSVLGHETRWGVPGQSEADLIEQMRQDARAALALLAPTHAVFSRKGRVAGPGGAGGRKGRAAAGAPPGPAAPPGGAVAGPGSGGGGVARASPAGSGGVQVAGAAVAAADAACAALGLPVAAARAVPSAPALPAVAAAPYTGPGAAGPAAAGCGLAGLAGAAGHEPVPMPDAVAELLLKLRPGAGLGAARPLRH